jgi:hypothetical protein
MKADKTVTPNTNMVRLKLTPLEPSRHYVLGVLCGCVQWVCLGALLVLLMAGCATGTSGRSGLSWLGREVTVTPMNGQSIEQLRQDDRECEAWTRQTKGPQEPVPAAELRYAA